MGNISATFYINSPVAAVYFQRELDSANFFFTRLVERFYSARNHVFW